MTNPCTRFAMKLNTPEKPSVIHFCDICKKEGLLNQNIFNHEGWYYCPHCLNEITRIKENLFRKIKQPSLF
jgi:hypothetical protein